MGQFPTADDKISVTDQPLSANGRPGTPETFSFDLRENKTDAAVVASDLAVSAAATSIASDPVAVPASSPLQYYLKIDGLKGDVTAQGFEGWFAVDGYDIGVQNTGSIGSAGGGAGVGKAQFSPLTVDIHSLAGLASLFGDVASGHALKSLELAGVANVKDKSTTVYDLKLSEVLVGSFKNDPGTQGVETELAFNFGRISLTDQPLSANGRPGTAQTFAFDLRQNKADAAIAASDAAVDAQLNNMALALASFMASSTLGSAGAEDLASTSPPQDNHLTTLAAAHG
jgi:type VI secretion system secreted protein Hcp